MIGRPILLPRACGLEMIFLVKCVQIEDICIAFQCANMFTHLESIERQVVTFYDDQVMGYYST